MKGNKATKLPSQVAKIGEQSEQIAVETGIKPGSKPVGDAATQATTLKPEPAKTDPNDYKTRYSNYKKATDETITNLRQDLAGRDATITELRTQLTNKPDVIASSSVSQPAQSVAGTKEDPVYKKWYSDLQDHIKTDYEEGYLFDQWVINNSLNKVGSNSETSKLEAKVDGIVKFQNKTKDDLYYEAMDEAYPDNSWIKSKNDKDWELFCDGRVSDVDSRTYGEIVGQGDAESNATTVIWVLDQYKTHQAKLENSQEAVVDPLMNHLTPESSGGGGDPVAAINAQAETFTKSQVDEFFKEVSTGDTYTAEQAKEIELKIYAAGAAGKIIPG